MSYPKYHSFRMTYRPFLTMLFPFVLQDNCAGNVDVDVFVRSNQFSKESVNIGVMHDSLTSEQDVFVAVEPRE